MWEHTVELVERVDSVMTMVLCIFRAMRADCFQAAVLMGAWASSFTLTSIEDLGSMSQSILFTMYVATGFTYLWLRYHEELKTPQWRRWTWLFLGVACQILWQISTQKFDGLRNPVSSFYFLLLSEILFRAILVSAHFIERSQALDLSVHRTLAPLLPLHNQSQDGDQDAPWTPLYFDEHSLLGMAGFVPRTIQQDDDTNPTSSIIHITNHTTDHTTE